MRRILVPTAAQPECALALDLAFRLAKTLDANVSGCHVRAERYEPASRTGTQTAPDRLTSAAARQLFAATADRHAYRLARRPATGRHALATWYDMVGTPERIFGIVGPVADLAVVSRPKARSAGRAKAFLLAALLHSGKPVLIVPQRRIDTIGRRIVIAWNQSIDAATTVAAGLPLLQRAEQVTIVACGPENRAGPKSAYLAQYLADWDIDAERVSTKGRDVESELQRVYTDTGADLLVMGAYSRHWFRERLFGGVTEHMLFRTEVPAFMLHR